MRNSILSVVVAVLCVSASARSAEAQPVTTVITHGYSLEGSKGAWIEGMCNAIIARAGGLGAVCRYDQMTGSWRVLSGSLDSGQPVCLIYRWLQDFDKPGEAWGFAEGAADAMYAALRDPQFTNGAGQPIAAIDLISGRNLHFLGHSRGTVVNSEVVQRLGAAGIAVDHVTMFDPHPMDGTLDWPVNFDWGDPMPHHWANTIFTDNYWRADGGVFNATDPDGIPIPGAYNVNLNESTLNSGGYSIAHSDTHLWYHGTIDWAVNASDGEQTITQTMRNNWWPNGFTTIGYYYAQLGGGVASRPAVGAGDAIGTVPTIYGGTFDQASQAGWLFHGGSMGATVVNEGGRTFAKFGPGFGTLAVHNRFYLPVNSAAFVMSYRILTPDTTGLDDVLRVRLIDADGMSTDLIGTLDLTQPDMNWVADLSFAIPASIQRGHSYLFEVRLDGGAATHATVGVDDIRIEFGEPTFCTGDIVTSKSFNPPPDGVVDGADLAYLLGEWGTNKGSPADFVDSDTFLPPPDGVVDGADLAVLLGAWGACD